MSAESTQGRRLLLGLAAATYAGVFIVFVLFEQSGLGIGHFFYIAICLVGLATDTFRGALGGVLAAALYALAVIVAPSLPAGHVLTESTAIRLMTYTLVGALVGRYASGNRMLVARLRDHAAHDFLTGIGNARVFDEELSRRCAAGKPFTVVLADLDDLKRLNDEHGHEAGNAALRRVGDALSDNASLGDQVARIGGDEFGIISSLTSVETGLTCARIGRALAAEGLHLSFGTTAYPQDGTTAIELFRKADDRLFAAKLVSRNRRTVFALG